MRMDTLDNAHSRQAMVHLPTAFGLPQVVQNDVDEKNRLVTLTEKSKTLKTASKTSKQGRSSSGRRTRGGAKVDYVALAARMGAEKTRKDQQSAAVNAAVNVPTPEQRTDVESLVNMGLGSRSECLHIYLACDKDVNQAASILMDQTLEGEGKGKGEQEEQEEQHIPMPSPSILMEDEDPSKRKRIVVGKGQMNMPESMSREVNHANNIYGSAIHNNNNNNNNNVGVINIFSNDPQMSMMSRRGYNEFASAIFSQDPTPAPSNANSHTLQDPTSQSYLEEVVDVLFVEEEREEMEGVEGVEVIDTGERQEDEVIDLVSDMEDLERREIEQAPVMEEEVREDPRKRKRRRIRASKTKTNTTRKASKKLKTSTVSSTTTSKAAAPAAPAPAAPAAPKGLAARQSRPPRPPAVQCAVPTSSKYGRPERSGSISNRMKSTAKTPTTRKSVNLRRKSGGGSGSSSGGRIADRMVGRRATRSSVILRKENAVNGSVVVLSKASITKVKKRPRNSNLKSCGLRSVQISNKKRKKNKKKNGTTSTSNGTNVSKTLDLR